MCNVIIFSFYLFVIYFIFKLVRIRQQPTRILKRGFSLNVLWLPLITIVIQNDKDKIYFTALYSKYYTTFIICIFITSPFLIIFMFARFTRQNLLITKAKIMAIKQCSSGLDRTAVTWLICSTYFVSDVVLLLWQRQHDSKVRNDHSNNLKRKNKKLDEIIGHLYFIVW